MQFDKRDIENALGVLHELMGQQRDGWVTRYAFAKRFFGSIDEGSKVLTDSLISLPGFREFIVISSYNGALKLRYPIYEADQQPSRDEAFTWTDPRTVARAVRNYGSTLGYVRIPVAKVEVITQVRDRFVSALQLNPQDDFLHISVGTPAILGRCDGLIVGNEGSSDLVVYFLSRERPIEGAGTLSIDHGFLYSQLAGQIESLESEPMRFNRLMSAGNGGNPRHRGQTGSVMSSADLHSTLMTRASDVPCLVWGPPGAGKTHGLGEFVAAYHSQHPEHRILLLAPSNLAADELTLSAVRALSESQSRHLLRARRVLRYGYPAKHELLICEEVLGSQTQHELTHEIARLSQAIERGKKSLSDRELAVKRSELVVLREELKNEVAEHLATCQIVASSTTLGFMPRSPIHSQDWDLVLVDEVTMVPPAQIYFLAALARKQLILAGDPRQLGPVFQESRRVGLAERAVFADDIYAATGIVRMAEGESSLKDSCALLRVMEQRRCHPKIWSLIKKWYPSVNVYYRQNEHFKGRDALTDRVYHVDVGNCPDSHAKQQGKSWINDFSANVCLDVAAKVIADNPGLSVGIITPYSAQERHINKYIETLHAHGSLGFERDAVTVGTVHKFQGSSADVIIFDFVGSNGKYSIGPLLSGPNGTRMLTVAFSRAKELLILVADSDWHKRMMDSSNPLLSVVFRDHQRRSMVPLESKSLIARLPQGASVHAIEAR